MATRTSWIRRSAVLGAAAVSLTVAAVIPAVAAPQAAADTTTACINGVYPLNPYVVNCNLPPRGHHTIGAAPDAGAIIACRHNPICLSYYVNYPGTLLVPGYRP